MLDPSKPEAEVRDDVSVRMLSDVMEKQGLERNAVTKLSEQQTELKNKKPAHLPLTAHR